MGMRETLRRLEARVTSMNDRELCPHLPPLIHWADGSTENDSLHTCGRPRLVIWIGYSDGSDKRTEQAARTAREQLFRDLVNDIINLAKEEPRVPIEERIRWAVEDYLGHGYHIDHHRLSEAVLKAM